MVEVPATRRRGIAQFISGLVLCITVSVLAFPSTAQDTTTTTGPKEQPQQDQESSTTTAPQESTTTEKQQETTTTEASKEATTTKAPQETTTTEKNQETTTTEKQQTTTTRQPESSTTTQQQQQETTTTSAPQQTATTAPEPAVEPPPIEGEEDKEPSGNVSAGLAGALVEWNKRVQEKETELAAAERTKEHAEQLYVDTLAEIEQTKLDVVRLDHEARIKAIRSFTDPDIASVDFLGGEDLYSSIRMKTILGEFVDRSFDSAEQLKTARQELEIKQLRADEARKQADAAAETIKAELTELELARDRKAALTTQIASQLGVVTRADIVTVYGFEVHKAIERNVRFMIGDAADQGYNLGGSGYRSFERQVAIRRKNCGTSHYAVWQMPSRNCRPPTARPGASQHEVGLALDLTCDGVLIRSRNNRCFQWLAANASVYGFKNLKSEPWHWSTTGR